MFHSIMFQVIKLRYGVADGSPYLTGTRGQKEGRYLFLANHRSVLPFYPQNR